MSIWHSFEQRFPLLTDSLKNAKLGNRLGHAYLIESSGAEVRLEFPRILACLAACTNPNPDGTPCEHCTTCRTILDGVYPDLFQLEPISKSRKIEIGKGEDDPDTLRSFEAAFHLSSTTESGWKIGIIHEADTMTTNAQNAFLKTLEEPPQKCIFILTTGRMASLLPTTRSRCQILSMSEQRCKYDMVYFAKLPGILKKLQFESKNDIVAINNATVELLDVLGGISEDAKKTIEEKWAPKLAESENLESAGMTLLEKRVQGEIGCEYRRLREQFLSILHTWFAEIALSVSGIDDDLLPNPEVIQCYLSDSPRPAIREREAMRHLNEADDLLKTLRLNVNDELALRTFALNVGLKH